MVETNALVKFIRKGFAVDGLSACPRTSWVAALNHKVSHKAMEYCVVVILVTHELYSRGIKRPYPFQAQLNKVAARLWCLLGPKLNINIAFRSVQKNLK